MYILCCVHTKRKENIIASGEQVVAAGCHGNYSGEIRNKGSGVNRHKQYVSLGHSVEELC